MPAHGTDLVWVPGLNSTEVLLPLAIVLTNRSSSPETTWLCEPKPLFEKNTDLLYARFRPTPMYGVPYMGVGRNLAYRRSVFFSNKGFGSHNHVVSGDDDLLVN